MALPDDDKVDLLVCDAVRQNIEGKFDIAGLYPTREVKIDPAATMPVNLNLTFVFVLKDGEGTFRAIHRIIDPLGKELHKFDTPEFKKLPGQAHVMMLPVGLIPIVHAGNYVTSLEIDGRHYRRTVRVFQ